ncbi:hypothetical protein BS50DRAFT_643633 [Corynespora cassiicola Philippines]|uniref:YDG domain-containing protein n=1 Tax=Corynespora cassiicola Philippines TaxID=1448308 RepID=A0A2T2PBI6_CORCC|nr:hypothetical protein BS50DRAFT_643633 [Corynespora cassiicola Philippines]
MASLFNSIILLTPLLLVPLCLHRDHRLRQIASWIRDDLDPVIAREGPDHLRADDVLSLHEIFQALRSSTAISALDLRATGIHRAVMEVSGTATRWPGRLADDCDRIITVWSVKFGRLDALHPFMYGRGGRLEGIAQAEEISKVALIKRWQSHCPEKLAPKRSHRHGDLGFSAGSWWLNSLFACHAGIIDLDSVDGGVCFDKQGAYALLLKDSGEIEAPNPFNFTYRCKPTDRGRFRLTAATPKSRVPIRVLRSHTLNSVWGPKVGVRYEGLWVDFLSGEPADWFRYRVTGWTVRQVKPSDIVGLEFATGDIMYEIKFERVDTSSVDGVLKHPTANEADDYLEYKRLRRVYREGIRKGAPSQAVKAKAKAAPPIQLPQAGPSTLSRTPSKVNPPKNRTTNFRKPLAIIEPILTKKPVSFDWVVATRVPSPISDTEELSATPSRAEVEPPTQATVRSHLVPRKSDSPDARNHQLEPVSSKTSSNYTAETRCSDFREVIPWDYIQPEDLLTTPQPQPHTVAHHPFGQRSRESTRRDRSQSGVWSTKSTSRNSLNLESKLGKKKSEELKRHRLDATATTLHPSLSKKASRRSVFTRSRNPLVKLFDGAKDCSSDEGGRKSSNMSISKQDSISMSPGTLVVSQGVQPILSKNERELHSPAPFRPLSPLSPLTFERRDAVCFPYDFTPIFYTPKTPSIMPVPTVNDPFLDTPTKPTRYIRMEASLADDPFIDTLVRPRHSLPGSLKDFISKPKAAAPLSSSASTPVSGYHMEAGRGSSDSQAAYRLKKMVREDIAIPIRVIFKNPFDESRGGERRESCGAIDPNVDGSMACVYRYIRANARNQSEIDPRVTGAIGTYKRATILSRLVTSLHFLENFSTLKPLTSSTMIKFSIILIFFTLMANAIAAPGKLHVKRTSAPEAQLMGKYCDYCYENYKSCLPGCFDRFGILRPSCAKDCCERIAASCKECALGC